MLPRSHTDQAAKPQSSMAVLNNVLRVLERPGEQLAPRITAHSTLAGILLEHIENFGALSLVSLLRRFAKPARRMLSSSPLCAGKMTSLSICMAKFCLLTLQFGTARFAAKECRFCKLLKFAPWLRPLWHQLLWHQPPLVSPRNENPAVNWAQNVGRT